MFVEGVKQASTGLFSSATEEAPSGSSDPETRRGRTLLLLFVPLLSRIAALVLSLLPLLWDSSYS